MSPTKHEQMRNLNTLSVLDFIRQHGQSTRRDIQTATGLSWAAVSTISTDLIAKNILKESAYPGHLAGRNPAYLNFSPMRNLTIGMELNAEGLTVLLLGLRCEVIDSRIEAIRSLEHDDVLRQMLGAVEAILEANRLNSRELLGIGIAVQGSVDREGSTSLYNSFFRDWKNVPLKKICEERFGVEVRIIQTRCASFWPSNGGAGFWVRIVRSCVSPSASAWAIWRAACPYWVTPAQPASLGTWCSIPTVPCAPAATAAAWKATAPSAA